MGCRDLEAHNAAVKALQAVWPLPRKEASAEVTRAVRFATLPKVATEMALNVLAYNMKRVIAIVGVGGDGGMRSAVHA
jgi:hypothetical protein